jgi:uncharacterized membrane protein YeaQ/YmgE (transglycosylase-associated protein family)
MEPRSIIGWIVLGLIAGVIAKALRPGKDPGGWIITIIIGIIGSFIGGFIAHNLLGWNTSDSWWQTLFVAIGGAILLLWIYAMATRGRRSNI